MRWVEAAEEHITRYIIEHNHRVHDFPRHSSGRNICYNHHVVCTIILGTFCCDDRSVCHNINPTGITRRLSPYSFIVNLQQETKGHDEKHLVTITFSRGNSRLDKERHLLLAARSGKSWSYIIWRIPAPTFFLTAAKPQTTSLSYYCSITTLRNVQHYIHQYN